MPNGELRNITDFMTRDTLGIRSDVRPVRDALAPIENPTDELFERSDSMSWLSGKKDETEGLDSDVIEFSRLALNLYNQIHDTIRERLTSGGVSTNQRDHEYGKHTKIVGKVSVSPAGPQDRWMVNFTTTHIQGESDWRATASLMMFDVQSKNLDHRFPARDESWVVGVKDGHRQIIGNYQQLHAQSSGQLSDYLVTQGWENIGEIWAGDVDRHGGFLTPPVE